MFTFIFQPKSMHANYMHALHYIHTVHIYMTSVSINVSMIMFKVYITALACFDRYAKAATLIISRLRTDYG